MEEGGPFVAIISFVPDEGDRGDIFGIDRKAKRLFRPDPSSPCLTLAKLSLALSITRTYTDGF